MFGKLINHLARLWPFGEFIIVRPAYPPFGHTVCPA